MTSIDQPPAPPQEPELDLRRHPRTDTQPISIRDWRRFTRGEACPACGHADTRPSHRSPWWAALFGLRSRRCRACRALYAQVRPAELLATVVLALLLLGGLAEVARRATRATPGPRPAPAGAKGDAKLPPPVLR
ncbi:MAG: hypothetical protein KJ067_24175 [Vicinamibacteria bacterium]|nr:hypothetical protein [Vicinamibacteria bacterium]